MEPARETPGEELDGFLVETVIAAVQRAYDPESGGLDFDPQQSVGPKFPVPSRLRLLQARVAAHPDAELEEMIDKTLEAMLRGGLRDHLGGGFHRYSTDRRWQVPHFEKMLYDNAQLARVYVDAFQRTGRDEYRETAEQTLEFVLRDLTDAGGGFYAALDAETDGIEGQHYVWSLDEINRQLGPEQATLFADVYGLNAPEVFEHGRILHLRRNLDESAADLGLEPRELQQRLAGMRDTLLDVRRQRPPLLRDDKILTSWNGLMIGALARAGLVLDRPDYLDAAARAAQFLLNTSVDEEGRLLRTCMAATARLNAYLDDYAFLVQGLLELHAATEDEHWLAEARRLTDQQIERFWDENGHGFFFTSNDHEVLLARTRNAYDGALPAGNGVSVQNLVRLARLTGEPRYQELARQTASAFTPQLRAQPASSASLALALSELLADPSARTLSVDTEDPAPASDAPRRVVVQRPQAAPDDEPLIVAARTDPRKRNEIVTAKAYLSADRLPAGGTAQVAVVLTIQDTWHINTNPAMPDFLIPTEVSAKSQHKTTLAKVNYPRGGEFRLEGLDEPVSVYEKQVTLIGLLQVPASAAGQTEDLDLTVDYQACNDKQCLPPSGFTLKIRVPVAAAGQPVKPINRRLFEPSPR